MKIGKQNNWLLFDNIAELVAMVNSHFAEDPWKSVFVTGEISNLHRYGHNAYFKLKDTTGVVNAMLDCNTQPEPVVAALKDGTKLEVCGRLEMYAPRGDLSLIVQRVRLSGAGDLMAQFEALKKKLTDEGLFDTKRKRPLPMLARRIGVVTSAEGAVIHDICTVTTRRFPNVHIRLYPARVQGEGAAAEIIAGINYFNTTTEFQADVLVVGRGGGSIEDLWQFNDEALVRAVAASRIPIVSAVGHETDFTLCDFAADRRAATPSMAAEIIVPEQAKLLEQLANLDSRLMRGLTMLRDHRRMQLEGVSVRLVAASPANTIRRNLEVAAAKLPLAMNTRLAAARQKFSALEVRLYAASPANTIRRNLEVASAKLPMAMNARLTAAKEQVKSLDARLNALNPLNVLQRGYSVTLDASGNVIREPSAAAPGSIITTHLAGGKLKSQILPQ